MNLNQTHTPQVLHFTDHWIVVDKPAGWLTIPGRSGPDVPVLREWLREKYGDVWVVHRLDRETSGVVLFARTSEDHLLGNLWFRQRKVKKVYLCLAEGNAQAPFFKVSEPIEGLASSTQVEVLEKFQGAFLAKAFPRTGRRHQIRIHLAKSGYPLFGDPRYGGKVEVQTASGIRMGIPRVALHASYLELPTGEKFECPLPEDFAQWVDVMRSVSIGVKNV